MSVHSSVSRRGFLKLSALTASAALVRTSYAQALSGVLMEPRPVQTLLTDWQYYRGDVGGIWEVWRGKKATENLPWQSIAMPHCFNAYDAVDPDTPYYQGPGWYRLRLAVQNPFPNGRTLLHFEGAGQKAQLHINMEKIGEHVGGYDEFAFDITEAATRIPQEVDPDGKTLIAIRCDNSRDLEMIPSNLSDFSLYGGLYRKVHLVYLPAISLEQLHIQPTLEKSGPATIALNARLYNPDQLADAVQLQIRILSPDGSVIHAEQKQLAAWEDEKELLQHSIANPQRWSPETPSLYRCEVTLTSRHGKTQLVERFGLRHIAFADHGPFFLNGERYILHGTQRHEDHAGYAAAVPDDITRKEFQMIKDMGANFIRLAHYQQAPLVLELCNELGIFVWEEVPWCRGGLGNERYQQQAKDMLRHMINQHYNHPACLLWGLGNENDWPGDFPEFDPAKIRAFMQEQNDLAHSLDPSRPTCIRRCDFCKDVVDVYSPTLWAGWYKGRYIDYASMCESEMGKVKHFLHIEWGGDNHAQRHSEEPDRALAKLELTHPTDQKTIDDRLTGGITAASKNGDWSESYICNLFDWHLKTQEVIPNFTGSAQWVFKDFSTPLRPENPLPRINQKGVTERDLTPKEGYYVFQSYWAQKPMAHIYGHSWPIRWGQPQEQKLVKVYSNCATAELFLNGASCGTKKRDSQSFPAAGLRWLVTFQPGENHLRVVAHKNGRTATDEIRFQYQTSQWSEAARLDLREIERTNEIITLEVRLFDAKNIQCLDARNVIRFGITGDGMLLDNLGTSRGSRVLQLYNGRATMQVAQRHGSSVISAASTGLPITFTSIKA